MPNVQETRQKCTSMGCDATTFDKAAALPGINVAGLLVLVEKYGPEILTAILSLFGQTAPTV